MMEQLREENHKLNLKLENLKKTHATELEYLREELDLQNREFKQQISKLTEQAKCKEDMKNEKIQELTEELHSLRDEHENAIQNAEKLRVQVDILKHGPKTPGHCGGSFSEYEGLKESNRILKSQLVEKDELLTQQTEKIRALGAEVLEASHLVARLTEEVEGKDSVVKEMNSRVKGLEREKDEELGAAQHEIMSLREQVRKLSNEIATMKGDTSAQPVAVVAGGGNANNGNTRGNSLFSEVEERRLKVESELSRLRSLVKKLSEEKHILQLELERGDSHSAAITTQLDAITKSEQELEQEIKKDKSETLKLFDSYRDRLDTLRSEYNRKLQQYKINPNALPIASELEQIRSDRDSLQHVKLTLERETNELKRELKYNKHLRAKAESNLKICKSKLDFFKDQQKSEPTQQLNTSPPKDNLNLMLDDSTVHTKIMQRPQSEQCNQQ